MFQLTYVTFYFGHISLTTKLETNWTEKDLCPPITEHHVNVRFTFKSVFLTGFKEGYNKLFGSELSIYDIIDAVLQQAPLQTISMSQVEIIYAIALFDDSLRMV